jgi:3-phosphoglycerate kinase
MAIRSIRELAFNGKKALVRCDFNVPLEAGKITDPNRIDASLDTIRHILAQGGAAILCSHLGRPKERTPDLSLKPVAEYLSNAFSCLESYRDFSPLKRVMISRDWARMVNRLVPPLGQGTTMQSCLSSFV